LGGPAPGSPWWRAVIERLMRDTAESRAHWMGFGGPGSSPSVAHAVEFVERPSVHTSHEIVGRVEGLRESDR
jgi:hypothetical protein